MSVTVKTSDRYAVTFSADGMDLTGCTVRLLAKRGARPAVQLNATVTNASTGEITHQLTGLLAPGDYRVELEATRTNGERVSFPTLQDDSPQYEWLYVIKDLDSTVDAGEIGQPQMSLIDGGAV